MRHVIFALALILAPLRLTAFELEDFHRFDAAEETAALKVISTADMQIFRPLIVAFQARNPGVAIEYTVASSTELMKAIYEEGAAFDLAISSAMDLQTKLANDGLARTHLSDATQTLPEWARWRDQVIAFTQEPAAMIVSAEAFDGLDRPETRADLVALLRANEARFRGRIGTYDIRASGLGYLFATQDSRQSESYWQLMEAFGRLDARLYCCSGDMIDGVLSGQLAFAYNVLGSYARRRLTTEDGAEVLLLSDFTNVMLRSALIPSNAANWRTAGDLIDFLVSDAPSMAGALPPPLIAGSASDDALRPISFGPELLVFLDGLRRKNFLSVWTRSLEQP
ncbi:MAG: extracellular solute-binding protein [Pseudomonadota bacterium]